MGQSSTYVTDCVNFLTHYITFSFAPVFSKWPPAFCFFDQTQHHVPVSSVALLKQTLTNRMSETAQREMVACPLGTKYLNASIEWVLCVWCRLGNDPADAEYSSSWTTNMIFVVRNELQYLTLKICTKPESRGPVADLMFVGTSDVNITVIPSTEWH